jgi:hypothetical protein
MSAVALLTSIGVLRSPVFELIDNAFADVEHYLSTTLDGVTPGVDWTRLTNGVRPNFPVNSDRPAMPAIVVDNYEIRLAVL